MKKIVLSLIAILSISANSQATMSEADTKKAYSFVEEIYKEINSKILNSKLSRDKKYLLVKSILIDNMDINKISSFVLGKNWKSADDRQKDAFKVLFTEFQTQKFTNILGSYKGQKISILGTEKASGKKQTFVNMKVVNEKDKKAEPIELKWRTRKSKSSFKIVDVIIGGVSMTLTWRNDYNSLIKKAKENGHDGMDTLIAELDKKIELERNSAK